MSIFKLWLYQDVISRRIYRVSPLLIRRTPRGVGKSEPSCQVLSYSSSHVYGIDGLGHHKGLFVNRDRSGSGIISAVVDQISLFVDKLELHGVLTVRPAA